MKSHNNFSSIMTLINHEIESLEKYIIDHKID